MYVIKNSNGGAVFPFSAKLAKTVNTCEVYEADSSGKPTGDPIHESVWAKNVEGAAAPIKVASERTAYPEKTAVSKKKLAPKKKKANKQKSAIPDEGSLENIDVSAI